jgi:alcohol dehydrogenase class IV
MQDAGLALRKFVAPEIVFGAGARRMAGGFARNLGLERVLLVSDPGVDKAGWTSEVLKSLEKENIASHLFTDVSPNPRVEEVMHGAEIYREKGCSGIVAVGGGSPMDCAKGIGIVAASGGHILEYEGVDRIRHPVPPLIFVPTTSGTSADVSQFAIISNRKELVKIAIVSKAIVPDVALIDPVTLLTMDPYLTACTGMDALVHAMEAFVSTAASPMTDLHALEAVRLVTAHLPACLKNPEDVELRGKLMLGSLEAGLAFSNAILGAVHAMAHSLGGFLDLPHGECNALLLEHVVNFNYDHASERYKEVAKAFGLDVRGLSGREIQSRLVAAIQDLKRQVGVVRTLHAAGVQSADIPVLASKAVHDACLLTNPRKAGQKDIETIYAEAF